MKKKSLLHLVLLVLASSSVAIKARAQTPPYTSYSNFCTIGNTAANVSGLKSTNLLQASYPSCTVTVYLTGTSTLATLYSNSTGTSLANPFTANTNGSFTFYAANASYDVTLSGGTGGGFPAPFTIPDITIGGTGGGGGGGGTINGTTAANTGVGAANAANTLAPVPEVAYQTSGSPATTTFTCQEDHLKGDWDVRCPRNGGVTWYTNPSQALVNTIQAAECYHFIQGGTGSPVVHIPAGAASIGGNISLPAALDVEGVGGTEYGFISVLNSNDATQQMFTHVPSQTFTCNGNPYTVNAGMATLGNVTLQGHGAANANDIGLVNSTSGGATFEYLHNVAFQNFGGPGRTIGAGANGQNSRGDHIWSAANLQWYYYGGAYNTSGFTDTAFHCGLELGDLDSRWDHIEATGQLQDSGYYNRYYLCGVGVGGGGQNSWIKDSYIQLAPHDIVVYPVGNGGQLVQGNRLDGGWWDSIDANAGTIISNNLLQGYCTSPTLNPTNFSTNPGGVTTDANCAAIKIYAGALGSTVENNSIGNGIWSQWPVYASWSSPNVINGATTTFEQPGATPGSIGGQIGGDSGAGNVGADVVRSIHQTSSGNHANTGPTIHFQGFQHTYLNDSSATNYTTADGIWPDTFVTVQFKGASDTITAGSGITLCGAASSITSGIHEFYTGAGATLVELCPTTTGGGGSGISGLTANYIPKAGSATTLNANSALDDGVTTAGVVTSTKPIAINDGSGFGGGSKTTEAAKPTGTFAPATGFDVWWASLADHWLAFNPNNSASDYLFVGMSKANTFTAGDCLQVGATLHDLVDAGNPCGTGGGGTGYFVATAAAPAAASQTVLDQVAGVGRIQAFSANNTVVGSFSIVLTTADGTSIQSFPMQCTSTGCVFNIPAQFTVSIKPQSPITTVSCSTSGTVTFAQPFAGTSYRSVNAHLAACVGTAAYTYPNGFTYAPFVSGGTAAVAAVSSATTTVLSINASSSTTGFVKVEEQD